MAHLGQPAQFAPVAPPHLLRKLRQEFGDWAIGHYHLVLAHDIAESPDSYADLFPQGSFIIMDNSMIELGRPVGLEVIEAALAAVKARVIVLPDVEGDRRETVKLTKEFIKQFRDPKRERRQDVPFHYPQFMAVPQGRNEIEIMNCARDLVSLNGVSCWGVPRTTVKYSNTGSRVSITNQLSLLNPKMYTSGRFIHQLGFSEDIRDDLIATNQPYVMGIDSAVPLRMGQAGKMMHYNQNSHEPRGDFWTRPVESINPATVANLACVRHWVQESWIRQPDGNLSPRYVVSHQA